MIVATAIGGCAGGATEGYAFTLRVSYADERRAVESFRLRSDGSLAYNVGIHALNEDEASSVPVWRAVCSREELAPIVSLLRAEPNPATRQPVSGEDNYKMSLTAAGHADRRFVSGPMPFFVELMNRCKGVMLARRPDLAEPNPGR